MGKSKSQPAAPKVPTVGQNLQSWVDAYSANAPQISELQLGDINTQIAAMNRLAGNEIAMQGQYGTPYNQAVLQSELATQPLAAQVHRGQIGQDIETLNQYGGQLRAAASDPQTERIRALLGGQIESELGLGATLDPSLAREVEQSVRAAQSARGMIRGQGAVNTEALFKGLQAELLRRARQQAASQFLQTNAATQFDPYSAITGRSAVRNAAPYQSPQTGTMGFSTMTPQGLGMASNANNLQSQLSYNAQQANAANQGWGTGETIGRVAAAPFTAGLSLFL